MIDKQVFAVGMGQLGGAFGREIDGAVSRMYYSVLSPHLTNEQFVDAITRTIGAERFWPAPAVILEKAGVSPDQRSHGAFRVVADALFQHGGFRFIPAEIAQSWDASTWAGIRAVGGLKEISCCEEKDWLPMQRKFQRAYEASLNPAPKIDAPPIDQRILQLVDGVVRDRAIPPGDR